MKTHYSKQFITTLAVTAAIALIAGCKSGNYSKGAATGADLQAAADKISAGKAKVDAVITPLNAMVANPQGDLVPQYKAFNSAVSDLQSTAQSVKDRVTAMRERGNEFVKEWDAQLAQIKNEDIKSRSAERKEAVKKEFMDIKKSYTEAQMSFQPFMADLKDINTALGTDLTASGVSAIKGAAEKATKESVTLKATMDQLATQFRELGVAMSSAGAAPSTNAPPAAPETK